MPLRARALPRAQHGALASREAVGVTGRFNQRRLERYLLQPFETRGFSPPPQKKKERKRQKQTKHHVQGNVQA